MRVLYLSYDGLTDGLGRSQVIPYLQGIARGGHQITVVSFEKPGKTAADKKVIQDILDVDGIEWTPLNYTPSPPVFSTIYDILNLRSHCRKLHAEKQFDVVHCRSYITSMVGLHLKRKFGLKFIFDMRAFYADERVDGGLWPQSSIIYRTVYNFFKKKEKEFLSEADHTISLTFKGREVIQSWQQIPDQPIPIEVIPCCADLEHFKVENVDAALRSELQSRFGIQENETIVMYLGSVGTWYMLPEMLAFFQQLLKRKPDSKFFFVTLDDPEDVLQKSRELGIPDDRFIIGPAKREEVPTYLSLGSFSLFFIKPLFSKTGSSPTKHGEMLGMGMPVICNGGVGDMDRIVEGSGTGLCINDLSEKGYESALDQLDAVLDSSPVACRDLAYKYYSLEEGVKKYLGVYSGFEAH